MPQDFLLWRILHKPEQAVLGLSRHYQCDCKVSPVSADIFIKRLAQSLPEQGILSP
jgi:hypothetical protein